MRKYAAALLGGLLGLASCGPGDTATVRPNPANRKPAYFNLLGFLEQQSTLLGQRRPAVEKQVLLRDGQQEVTRVQPTEWAKELQIFQQADINKPALRGLYVVDSAALSSGLVQHTYRRLPGTDHPVEQLTVVSRDSVVQDITASIDQDNPLVYSAKTVELHCQNGQLTSYRVNGVQKLILFDSVRYAVRGRVL
ncbi:hypothetical protein ACFPAF_09400 [Hymenobacter endophyticus]|uniref:Uncharacterized protein n=1 Tax=Hymenobacter endophyticus TaxID=3076335 RepID=A0ABU3TH91_9BACT|nr:hypothetical protein [Hymenobacter endophyticus]MDU0370605.1 hypothetical protein [Hymenobacter endophyticus]